MMLAEVILIARLAAFRVFEEQDVPSPAVVLAIIEHETRGNPRMCKDERNGSSSRGLMMRNRPHSRCSPEDNARFASDFNPIRNVKFGVYLLAFHSAWSRRHHKTGDPLSLYAGRGPQAERFAKEIRAMAAGYETDSKETHHVAMMLRRKVL